MATSLESFKTYQTEDAWTWEHLALTRARPVAGNPALGTEIDNFRVRLFKVKRSPAKTLADVIEMRDHLADAKPGAGEWDAKNGPGRLQDLELFAQTAALLAADPARNIAAQLAAGARIGWFSDADRERLVAAHALMSHLQSATRLLTSEELDLDLVGQGATNFLLRETGATDAADLARRLAQAATEAAAVIDTALGTVPDLP
ncbi:MAG: hypothetical protein ACU0DI_14070 [Paracoccaceae bacterium]